MDARTVKSRCGRRPKERANNARDIMFLRAESTISCDSSCQVRQRLQHHEILSSLLHVSGKIFTSTFSALIGLSSSAFPQPCHQPPRSRGTFLKQPRSDQGLATRFDTTWHQTAATTPFDSLRGALWTTIRHSIWRSAIPINGNCSEQFTSLVLIYCV